MNKKQKTIFKIILIFIVLFIVIFVIYYFNNKPKLYCFWTGNNPLTENRKRNLDNIKKCLNLRYLKHIPNNLTYDDETSFILSHP